MRKNSKRVASSQSTKLSRRILRIARSVKIFRTRGNEGFREIDRHCEAFGQVAHAEIQMTEQESITLTYEPNGVRARKIGD